MQAASIGNKYYLLQDLKVFVQDKKAQIQIDRFWCARKLTLYQNLNPSRIMIEAWLDLKYTSVIFDGGEKLCRLSIKVLLCKIITRLRRVDLNNIKGMVFFVL